MLIVIRNIVRAFGRQMVDLMYFADMSQYSYDGEARQSMLNVGWLDAAASYNKGEVSQELIQKLLRLCRKPVNRTRGWHRCPFCKPYPVKVTVDGEEICLGDAEIRVQSENGVAFAAPNLLCHYVRDHEYQPPAEFLDALSKME